jgi:hypothetical protein
MLNYSFYNIKYNKHPVEKCIVVTGDIRNDSEKNYDTAVFRVKLFVTQECIGSGILKIQGFRSKAAKTFEIMIEETHHKQIPLISKCEILFEAAY